MIYAGFTLMTSSGDESKVEKAKSTLKNALIGLIVILISWGVTSFIITRLSNTDVNGSDPCTSGETRSCGCGGTMSCVDGSFSDCIGSDPGDCANPPASCDSSGAPGCQKLNRICSSGYFCDDSCLCQTQGKRGDSCDSNLNNTTCDLDNDRCGEYLTCNPSTCLCDGPPVITSLSPLGGFCSNNINKACQKDTDCGESAYCNLQNANGAVSNFITISGKNFGEYSSGSSKLIFLGSTKSAEAVSPAVINSKCINFWTDTQIIVAVPQGAENGPIKIINKDGLEDITNNEVGPKILDFVVNNIKRPGLCSIDPVQGSLSTEVNYQGANLYLGKAYFGNYTNNVNGLNSNFTNAAGLSGVASTPNIKEGDSGSFVQTEINGTTQKSNYLRFVKSPEEGDGPYIMSFSPSEGAPGQYLSIIGSGFGNIKDLSKVFFVSGLDKIEASYSFPVICVNSVWTNNQIIVKVPANLVNGGYSLEIQLAKETITTQNLNPNLFTVKTNLPLKPSLCKINPEKGSVSTPVSFWGEYFGSEGSQVLVQFNYAKNVSGLVKKEKDSQTTNASVPQGAVTGPVKIVKSGLGGNEMNFSVSECKNNDDCSGKTCCPQNTYRKGLCVSSLDECFVDIKTSVFEWSFSTDLNGNKPKFDSCIGISKYSGSCYQGNMCPNSPGACSSLDAGYDKVVGSCDLSCEAINSCKGNKCTYNESVDRCVAKSPENCDLPLTITFSETDYENKLDKPYTTEKFCNSNLKWEITSPLSCPKGWTRGASNSCVQDSSSCGLCESNFACQKIGNINKCVSDELCKDKGASCFDNLSSPFELDNCVVKVEPACECCCRIGKDAEDCCAPLTCAGKCGSDVKASTNTYGSCSGCAAVGDTQEEHDAACNCSNASGKFCSISSENPQGICTDCAGIDNQAECGDHSATCCFDSNRTATTTDDVCRSIASSTVISTVKTDENYGYCGYFACDAGSPKKCITDTSLRVAPYSMKQTCIDSCPKEGEDICREFKTKESCSAEPTCCFDSKKKQCKSGNQIALGESAGYCAYYDCNKAPYDTKQCNTIASTTGKFVDQSKCAEKCANPDDGAGLGCVSATNKDACDFNLCSDDKLSCLQDTGLAGVFPGCGTCCCQPAINGQADSCKTAATPDLTCKADQGSCSGASRGLCCGCKSDGDCGSETTTGCGFDTCCKARPKVSSTSPAISATNVCRNAAIKISFDQKMDASSFVNNFLLFEERNYQDGVCPSGSFLASADIIEEINRAKNKNFIVRLFEKINLKISSIFNTNKKALALAPNADKLYCSVSGQVSSEEGESSSSLIFSPERVLSPAAVYFVVIGGDETLESQSGVLSSAKIGMNGGGFRESNLNVLVNPISFNGKKYNNAYSFQFRTLSSQGVSAGICAIDHVSLKPESYLFKTTVNDLNEKDDNSDSSFDTVSDSDKVFTAGAYSFGNQLLSPVSGYNWEWNWVLGDPKVIGISTSPTNLSSFNKLIVAQTGVTDSQTKLTAMVNMDKYTKNCGTTCNAFTVGDKELAASDIYVFVCANPWPAVNANGSWNPWSDAGNNCSNNNGSCETYNYKFYYCRDAGGPGTSDDLPAISNNPISLSGNLLCNSNNAPCVSPAGVNSSCDNGKGVCVWSVLKESYFFREALPNGAVIKEIKDMQTGGAVQLKWESPSAGISSYKIYYLKSGKGAMLSKEFPAAQPVCAPSGQVFTCAAQIVGLVDGQEYIFKISAVSTNKTESSFSEELTVKSSDKIPPVAPSNFNATSTTAQFKFSWQADVDPNVFYRLYHGTVSQKYGESFDSKPGASSLSLDKSLFKSKNNYFSLSAIDISKNESIKSSEKTLLISN